MIYLAAKIQKIRLCCNKQLSQMVPPGNETPNPHFGNADAVGLKSLIHSELQRFLPEIVLVEDCVSDCKCGN